MGHNKPIGKGQRGPMQAIHSAGALLGAEYSIWAHAGLPLKNHNVTNGPMREFTQHVSMGPYKHLFLFTKMGPCWVFRFERLECTWVVLTPSTTLASWALIVHA